MKKMNDFSRMNGPNRMVQKFNQEKNTNLTFSEILEFHEFNFKQSNTFTILFSDNQVGLG